MENPLISVIIPVYNVSGYLKQCLDSVIAQTYRNLEIILVDDGSTDGSGEICDEYSRNDQRIKVIHKENGGLSDARNAALDIIKGEYIAFIDSDDYVSKNYIEILYNTILEYSCNLAIGSYIKFVNDVKSAKSIKRKNRKSEYTTFTQQEVMLDMLYRRKCSMYAPGKLYKASLFDAVRFPKGMLFEDVPTMWNVIKQVDKVVFVNDILYFYRQRKESIVHQRVSEKSFSRLDTINCIMNEVSDDGGLYKAAVTMYLFSLFDLYAQVESQDKKNKDFLIREIKSYRKIVLHNRESSKLLRIMAGLSYLSFDIVKITGRMYKKFLYFCAKMG